MSQENTQEIQYIPPTKEEFRFLLKKWELTGSKAGDQVDLTSRTIRKYTGGQNPVPYGVLYTLFSKNEGLMIGKDWRSELTSSPT